MATVSHGRDTTRSGIDRGTRTFGWKESMVTRLRWTMSVESASVTLTSYRSKNTRKSLETLEKGLVLLKSGKHAKLGDEGKPIPRIVLLNSYLIQNGRS